MPQMLYLIDLMATSLGLKPLRNYFVRCKGYEYNKKGKTFIIWSGFSPK